MAIIRTHENDLECHGCYYQRSKKMTWFEVYYAEVGLPIEWWPRYRYNWS